MKRVIKNQKKMKNTMYIVFGVFALALFIITRTNTSYANDGLNIDRTLDAIVLYGTVETEADEEDLRENDEEDFDEEDDENHDKNQDEEQGNEEGGDEEHDEQEEQEQGDEQQGEDEFGLDDEQIGTGIDELNNNMQDDSDDNDEIGSEPGEDMSDENKNLVDAGDVVEESNVEEPEIILDDEISQSSEKIDKIVGSKSENVAVEGKEGYELLTTLVDEIQNENIEIMSTTKTVTYHPNGGAFSGMGVNETKNFTYNYSGSEIIPIYNIQIPNRESEDMSVQSGWMFAGWYTQDGNNNWGEEFDISNPQTDIAYAKWLPFGELDLDIGLLNGVKIMDRNMGAEEEAEGKVFNYATQHEDNSKLGLIYERGNNYGFSNSVLPNYSNDELVNTIGIGPNNYYYSNVFKYKIDKDYVSNDHYRWTIDPNNNLWGGNEQLDNKRKGICPKGYHIPTSSEWYRLTTNFNTRYSSEEGKNYCQSMNVGECMLKKYKLPITKELFMTSRFSLSNGTSTWIGSNLILSDYGHYRASTTPSSNQSGAYFRRYDSPSKTIYSASYTSRTVGGSVRCFKDTTGSVLIVFNSNGGTNLGNTYSVRRREDGTYFSNPKRDNSTFKGWYDNPNFNGERVYSNAIYVDSNNSINMYAKRECDNGTHEAEDKQSCITYKATIYPNGGEGETTTVEKIIPENSFIKNGAKFIGWNTQQDGKGKRYGVNNYLKEDIVLYAQRSENPVYYYNTNGGTFEDGEEVKLIRSDSTPKSETVSNNGHQNEPWRNVVKLTGSNSLTVEGNFSISRTNCIKAYNYDRNNSNENGEELTIKYSGGPSGTIKFSAVGDTVTIESICNGDYPSWGYSASVYSNNIFTYSILNINDFPIKSGYTFSGWYESGALEPFDFTGTEVTQDRIFYAKWNPNKYTIQLDSNGGNSPQTEIDATYGEEIVLPNATRDGYTFKGWKNENGNLYVSKIGEDESLTAEDGVTVTLTAQWEENKSNDSGSSSGGGKRVPSSDQDHGAADDKKTDDKKSEDVTDDTDKTDSRQKDASDNDENKSDKSDISENIESQTDISSENQVQYTNEQKESYSFAKSNGITTTSSIKEAKMNTSLKRIEMAKMLSYYAINVLGQEPDTSKGIVKFNDVSNKMDKQYDNGVTLSYQLGIMGQNMLKNKFRPNDEVTRAEFVTALSRMIYNTQDGKGNVKYYEPHMAKLYNEGIISNTNPKMKEKRGYVMTMLMRSAK